MAAGSGAVCANRSTSGVHTAVGAIALTRMFWLAYSIAALRVRPITPAFANVYGEMCNWPVRPAVEAVLTMLPPPVFSICAMQYFITKKKPSPSTPRTRCQSSTGMSCSGNCAPVTPALLKTTSMRP
jgi:hypothetical protein